MGLEGIGSKRTDAPYDSGLSKTWLKPKNRASETVRRECEEDMGRKNHARFVASVITSRHATVTLSGVCDALAVCKLRNRTRGGPLRR